MKNKLSNKFTGKSLASAVPVNPIKFYIGKAKIFFAFAFSFALLAGLLLPWSPLNEISNLHSGFSVIPAVKANNVYYSLSGGALNYKLTAATANLIASNDDWSAIASVEGYFGRNLSGTHGVDPQTILGTEFTNNALPSAGDTQVNANKGNPSAYNAGGVTEFDTGTPLGIGFQGNVQANPYLVFYINTVGRTGIKMSYTVTDLDTGSNNAVSRLALQYRVGETGNFTNVPEGFIADATDGPNLGGRVTTIDVTLPAAVDNQPKVQVRLITTNAANTSGSSTPDEWIGINNVVVGQLAPTAAAAVISGHVFNPYNESLANATIIMFDSTGNIQTTLTDSEGFYRFENVMVGETYILEVRSKKYTFSQSIQALFVTGDYDSLNFFASKSPRLRYFFPGF